MVKAMKFKSKVVSYEEFLSGNIGVINAYETEVRRSIEELLKDHGAEWTIDSPPQGYVDDTTEEYDREGGEYTYRICGTNDLLVIRKYWTKVGFPGSFELVCGAWVRKGAYQPPEPPKVRKEFRSKKIGTPLAGLLRAAGF